jgi:hypothetical protein
MPCGTSPFLSRVQYSTFHAVFVKMRLLVILVRLIVDNVEEAELVDTLGGGNDAEPVTELLLLEELLCATGIVSTCPL